MEPPSQSRMMCPLRCRSSRRKKGSDLEMGDVVEVEVAVQTEAMAQGTHGHCGDRRDLVALVAVDNQRRLAAGSPGAAHGGDEKEAAFVQENYIRPEAPGFFLISTQR